jgi:hypothetical protein
MGVGNRPRVQRPFLYGEVVPAVAAVQMRSRRDGGGKEVPPIVLVQRVYVPHLGGPIRQSSHPIGL